MIITGMDHFQSVCKRKLVEWYKKNRPEEFVFTVDRENCDVKVITSIKPRSQYEDDYSWFCFNVLWIRYSDILSTKKRLQIKSNRQSFYLVL